MTRVRKPAVAGIFYPARERELRELVHGYLREARRALPSGSSPAPPKAVIAPHAGLVCSGPIAASAYVLLEPACERVTRVLLVGPSHRVPLRGLAACGAEEFETPLGRVAVDRDGVAAALALPQVRLLDEAHAAEHSLEVQLPFLQEVLASFRIVPLVAGSATPREVGEVLEALWGGKETVAVVSSDLSHYHPYEEARALDRGSVSMIESLTPALSGDQACGSTGINGLLHLARRRAWRVRTLDLRSSGDTLGSRREVVGYGAFALYVAPSGEIR